MNAVDRLWEMERLRDLRQTEEVTIIPTALLVWAIDEISHLRSIRTINEEPYECECGCRICEKCECK